MKITNIEWEDDGEGQDLPFEIDLDSELLAEEIEDYLSNTYDFLVLSYNIEE